MTLSSLKHLQHENRKETEGICTQALKRSMHKYMEGIYLFGSTLQFSRFWVTEAMSQY